MPAEPRTWQRTYTRVCLGKGEEERDTTLPRVEINSWYDRYLKFGRGIRSLDGNILVFDGKYVCKEGGKTREGNAD